MDWDSSPVGDITGSTDRRSGVARGQGVVVGDDVTVGVAVGGFEIFLLRVRVGSTPGRGANDGVTDDPTVGVMVGDAVSVNVWVGVCVALGVGEASVGEAVGGGKSGVPVVATGTQLPRNTAITSSDGTIQRCFGVSFIFLSLRDCPAVERCRMPFSLQFYLSSIMQAELPPSRLSRCV